MGRKYTGGAGAARLRLTPLEDRTLPAVALWTGAGADNTWMTGANWQNGTPSPGDQLIFPATGVVPASFTNVNNFLAGTSQSPKRTGAAGHAKDGNAAMTSTPGEYRK